MKKYTLCVLAIIGLVRSAFALNWVNKPSSVQTGQNYTVSATHTFNGGGLAAGSIYIYKNGAFFAGNGNGGYSFTMSTSASTSDSIAGTITYTATSTVTPQGWGSGPMTQNISGTVTVVSPNIPPTVDWHTLPTTMYPNTWYAARATGSDGNGNLGGVWVEYRVNGGSWQALAYDPAGVNGGNGNATTTYNNGVTAGAAGTTYQFRCYAWDQANANSGWKESGVLTVVKRPQSSLTLNASTSQVFGTAQTLSTSGGSGTGSVSYAIVGQSASGVATLSGATLTANTGTGWVDVAATKVSDSDYNSATSNTVRVNLAKAGQASIAVSANATQTLGTAQTLGCSGGSGGGAITYAITNWAASDVATLTGATLTANSGTGWVDVQALKAGDANYNSTASPSVRVNLVPPSPAVSPATSVAISSFSANWAASTGASSYRLDVSTSSSFASFVAGYQNQDVGNVTSVSVTGLSASTTYYYRVRAVSSGGSSGNSPTTSLTTLPLPPGAPGIASASSIAGSSFTANWSTAGGATSYRLDVSTSSSFASYVSGYQNLDVGNVTNRSVTGLVAGTTYYYRVRAVNAGGTSGNSSMASLATIPAAPAVGNATTFTGSSFTANWTAATGATSYRLDVSTSGSFTSYVSGYQNLDVGNVTNQAVTDLAAGTTYYYRVRGVNAGGTSGNSSTVSLVTISAAPAVGSATSITGSSFTANWTAAAGATSYTLDVSTSSSFGSYVTGYQDLDVGNVTSGSVTGLATSTTYYYRLRAVNGSGTSGNSSTTSLTTLPPPPDAPAATMATSLASSGFTANWSAASGATGYRLDVSTSNTFATYVAGYQNRDVGNATSSVLSGLASGTNYFYRVRGSNTGGASGHSNTVSVLTLPGAPVAGAATNVTETSFTATWAAVTGASGYRIDVSSGSDFTSFVPGYQNLSVGNVTSLPITGLTSTTIYYYRVRAVNASGTGGNSGVASITTLTPPVAAAATGISVSAFTANWSLVGAATGYRLDVSTSSTFQNYVTGYQNRDVGNLASASIGGLSAGTTYYYRVRSTKAGGMSGHSNTIQLTTVPTVPTATAATGVLGTAFVANWSAVTGAASYRLDVSTSSTFSTFVGGHHDLNVGAVTSRLVEGLSAGTTYHYRVRAVSSGGTSGSSLIVSVLVQKAEQASLTLEATTTQTLGVPQSLSATGGTGGGALGYSIVNQSASGAASLSGATLTPNVGTGWVDVKATRAGGVNYQDVHSNTIRVTFAKATATVTLGNLSHTYDSSVKTASAITAPSGRSVTVSYGGGNRTDVGSYLVTATIPTSDPNYTGSATGELVIEPAPQTVSISATASSVTFGSGVTLTAAGGKNGYVWGGAAGGSGGTATLTPSAAGTLSATVYSPSGGNYRQSNTALIEVAVTRVLPVGTFPGKTVSAPYALSSTDLQATFSHPTSSGAASPTGAVTYSPAAGTSLSPGAHTITASYAGDGNYAPTTVTATFLVNKTTPTIDWTPSSLPFGATLGGSQVNAIAKVDGVTLAGSYVYTPESGTTTTTVGPMALSVYFTPEDTTNYNSLSVDRVVTVTRGSQAITFPTLSNSVYGQTVLLLATSSAGIPVEYSVSGPAQLAAVSGGGRELRLTGVGTVTVTATAPENDYYEAAPPVQRTFQVGKASQTIVFPDPRASAFVLRARASSGLPVTYETLAPIPAPPGYLFPAQIVTRPSVVPTEPDNKVLQFTTNQPQQFVRVKAMQAGNENYEAALDVVVGPFSTSPSGGGWVSRPADVEMVGTNSFLSYCFDFAQNPPAQGQYGTFVQFWVQNPSGTWEQTGAGGGSGVGYSLASGGITLTSAGTWTIRIVKGSSWNSPLVNGPGPNPLVITAKNSQSITFNNIGTKVVGDEFELGASASSNLGVSYSVQGPAAIVMGTRLRVNGPGLITVTAAQAGNALYAPALNISRSFTSIAPPRVQVESIDFSATTGMLLAEGWALDYEDGAPLQTILLVIDGVPQAPQAVQKGIPRADIVSRPPDQGWSPWSLQPMANCGWKVQNYSVATLAQGHHSVWMRVKDSSGLQYDSAPISFQGGKPGPIPQTIYFEPIPPKQKGEQFSLNAAASSGLPVEFSIVDNPHLLTLSGSLVSTGNLSGYVTIRARQPGSGTFAPVEATQTFTIGIADGNSNGVDDTWEQYHGIDVTGTSDADGDGVKDIDEYHLWSNPTSAGDRTPKDVVPVNLTVTAKGSGTVSLTTGGEIYNFSFTAGASGEWLEPDPFGPTPRPYPKIEAKLGEEHEVAASWSSSITDFVVKANYSRIAASELRSRVELSAPGSGTSIQFADTIAKSELVAANGGNMIKVRATVEGSLPFGVMDTSKLEIQRRVRFGLGGSRTGDSAGVIVYSARNTATGGGLMNFAIVKGPAMTDVREHISDPKRFQAKVPAGYVDVYRLRDLVTMRFFADGNYPDDGPFKSFAGATPVVAYSLGGVMRGSGSITQAAGDYSLILEYESGGDMQTRRVDNPGGSYTLIKDYVTTFKHWGWRKPAAPRLGLTLVRTETFQLVPVGADNNPGQPVRQPIFVNISRHQGPSTGDGILSEEQHQFAVGDYEFLSGATAILRGSGAEQQLVSHRYSVSPSTLLAPPTVEVNPTGGKSRTDYYSAAGVIGGMSDFGDQPHFVGGQPRTVKRSFLDGDPTDANAIVTTYTYHPLLVDGKAVPATAITEQGSIKLGDVSYSYPAAPAGQVTTKASVLPASSAVRLHTTTRAYSRRLADLDLRDKPISITRPDGTRTVFSYRPSGADLIVSELSGKSGSTISTFGGHALPDTLDMDANRSVATERTFDQAGRLKREATYLYRKDQGVTSFPLIGAIDYDYDDLGNLTNKTHDSGRVLYEAYYSGFRKEWEKDEQGITLTYTYDDYNRVLTMKRAAASDGANTIAETTTTYAYDQAGRLEKETVSATGTTETLVSSYTYDTANRPKKRTLPGGFETRTTYDSPTKTTTTLPGGGTKIEEVYKDGRVKSVSGTAVPDTTSTYVYDSTTGHLKTTQTTVGQWATTETDWAGRTLSVSTPTYAGTTRVVINTYDAGGRMTKQETRVNGAAIALPRVFEYDSDYSRLLREGLDADGSGSLSSLSDYDLTEYEFAYQVGAPNHAANLYLYEGVKIWPHAGANASVARYTSQTYTQVSGLSASTTGHVVSRDFDQNDTDTAITVDRSQKKVVTSTTTRGTTATLQQIALNGLPITSVNAQGHTTTQGYDTLGRLEYTRDPRIGDTDYGYFPGTTLLEFTTAPDGQTVRYTYDTAGRAKSQTNFDAKIAYFRYDMAGNLTHQWGDTVNPVKYVYNELGQKTEMHTYRSGTWTGGTLPVGFNSDGDKTTWTYQGTTGLLTDKTDAAAKTTSFQYTDLGQVMKRTDARGWVTDYEYTDPRKLLTNVNYADSVTTDLVYSYDRAGRTLSVTDALGERTFAYYDEATAAGTQDASARLKSETLPSTFGSHTLTYTYQYGVNARANGALAGVMLGTGTAYNVTYGYDAMLRPSSVAYNATPAFGYTYVPNSNLIDQVSQGAGGYLRDYDYRVDGDRLDKLKHAWGTDTAKQVETTVGYNSLGLRNTEKTIGANYMTALGRGSEAGVHADYTYTDRIELDDSGKYALFAGGALGGLRIGTARDYDYDAIGNRTADQSGAYTPNTLNQYSAAPGIAAFNYDANGNLTGDGIRTYTYDAENRLISVTSGGFTSTYKYDYLGRRIQKSVPGVGTTRFLYDGWNLIAELNSSNAIVRRFAWGLDVSGTLQGAGGVGGLLVIDDGVARRYPIYDASHNVLALYTSTGTLAAAYEYDPFGNTSTVAGTYATQNPFRFSTKSTDAETGFVYYGHRYYSPALGRFLNRDPIEEAGGLNLYGFCGNDGVNRWDYLGMSWWSDIKSFMEDVANAVLGRSDSEPPASGLTPEEEAQAAGEDRAKGEIIAKYGIVGFALGEGRGDRDVLNAYADGYNGFVDVHNARVLERMGGPGFTAANAADLGIPTGDDLKDIVMSGLMLANNRMPRPNPLRPGPRLDRGPFGLGRPPIPGRLGPAPSDLEIRPGGSPPRPSQSSGTRYVYDSATGRVRDVNTGRFVSEANLPWPPRSGSPNILQPGMIIDRFGNPTGRYAGEPGATVGQRGLPPGYEGKPYHQYEVLKPLPARSGPAAPVPVFGAPGGATEHRFDRPIEQLIRDGYLRPL